MRVGFIGFGNMAQAIAAGLRGRQANLSLAATALTEAKLQANCQRLGLTPYLSPQELVQASDIIFLAVKPSQCQAVLAELEQELEGKILLVVVGGADFAELKLHVTHTCQLLCCIPNIPVAVRQGLWICQTEHNLTEANLLAVNQLLSLTGSVYYLPAAEYAVGCSLAGCGPAFAALFIEALGDAALRSGLKRQHAYEIASKMLVGAGVWQSELQRHPAELKDAVCSPGGSTIKGIGALEEAGFRAAVWAALAATVAD